MSNPLGNIVRRLKSIKLSKVQQKWCKLQLDTMEKAKEHDSLMYEIMKRELDKYLQSIVDGKGYSDARYYLNKDNSKLEFVNK